jgi:hypothetical protein
MGSSKIYQTRKARISNMESSAANPVLCQFPRFLVQSPGCRIASDNGAVT